MHNSAQQDDYRTARSVAPIFPLYIANRVRPDKPTWVGEGGAMTKEGDTRRINTEVPREYHRLLRKLAAEHDLTSGEIVCWALQLLERYSASGGVYGEEAS